MYTYSTYILSETTSNCYAYLMTRSVQHLHQKAFALPTVLIGSVVMIIVMLAAITATVSVSNAINAQYYNKLSLEAGESGTAMAVSCIKQRGSVAWTSPLRPGTDCNGVGTSGYVLNTSTIRTSFSVAVPSIAADGTVQLAITSKTEQLRSSNGLPWKTYATTTSSTVTQKNDVAATRAAQRYWAFGNNVKIDFGTNGSTATAKVNAGSTDISEGATTVSDLIGNLLFWASGSQVWDKNGNTMGNSAGLNGSPTATQAVAVFPLDATAKTYIIVTNSASSGTGPGELYYSVIDMTLNSGLGGVTSTKNIKLGTASGYSSESLVAAPNAAGNGYWVMTYKPNTTSAVANTNMVAFQFKYDGSTLSVSGPVNSTIANALPTCSAAYIGFGTLNFNADYTKLVLRASGGPCPATIVANVGFVQLFDFNASSGQVVEKFSWAAGTSQTKADGTNKAYAADFSPAESYIYATQLYPGRLFRYKISGMADSNAVKASEEFVGSTSTDPTAPYGQGGGQVKRGFDGKMYVANKNQAALSVVNSPDALINSVNFVYNGFPLLSGSLSRWGLPQMVTYNKRVIVTY